MERAKRDAVLTDADIIQEILAKAEKFSDIPSCVVLLQDVVAPKTPEEMRSKSKSFLESTASSVKSSEKMPRFVTRSPINYNKMIDQFARTKLQSSEQVTKTQASSIRVEENKPNMQDVISKHYSDENGFKFGSVQSVQIESSSYENTPKAICICNTENDDKKNMESPEMVTKLGRFVTNENQNSLIRQKLDSFPFLPLSSDDIAELVRNKPVVYYNRGSPKNVSDKPSASVSQPPPTETRKSRDMKLDSRKLFHGDRVSCFDICMNDVLRIREATMKGDQVVPNSSLKKKSNTKYRDILKKRAIVEILQRQGMETKTDVSLAKTQDKIIQLMQMVQKKKKAAAGKAKFKGQASILFLDDSTQVSFVRETVRENAPVEFGGFKQGDVGENASRFTLGREQFIKFEVEYLINALAFASGKNLDVANLRKKILSVIDNYL